MKLRCISNSVRMRLDKSDIRSLLETGKKEEKVSLHRSTSFTFSLVLDKKATLPKASFNAGSLVVGLPYKQGMEWAKNDVVSLKHVQEVDSENSLELLIEKDFPCKDRPGEDKSNTFWELANNEC